MTLWLASNIMPILQGMLGIVDVGLWGLGLLLLSEVWAAQAFTDDKPVPSDSAARPRLAVLVPAHNEALHIKATVQSLLLQLNLSDRLIVIADNCEDDTAHLAAQAGASVLERISPQRGKGYALDYGLKSLVADPPDVVMIIDADCEVTPGSLEALALRAAHTQRPVQGTYLMTHSGVPTLRDRISEFALTLKNLVRPLGMQVLGWPCLLTGSGMAFPWSLLQSVSLAGNKTVDDMQLTIDLALQGKAPCYEPRACLTGRLMQFNAASSQRSRWEHGHLEVIVTQVPRLLRQAIMQRQWDALILALDLTIPPLSLLLMVWFVVILGHAAAYGIQAISVTWLWAAVGSGIPIGLSLAIAWQRFGQDIVPLRAWVGLPRYLLWKLPIYRNFVTQPQTRWLQTERDGTKH